MKRFFQRAVTTALMSGAVIAATAPAAPAAEIVSGICDDSGVVKVCIKEYAPTRVNEPLYTVQNGDEISIAKVAAYRDIYALGTRTFTCVTPVVDGVERDACGSLGFTRIERYPLVDETPVSAHTQETAEYARVYICEADLTVTVLGNGERNKPTLTVCGTGMPTLGTWGT